MAKTKTVTIRGLEVTIDTEALEQWSAFEKLMVLGGEEATMMEKLQVSFRLVEEITDVSQEDIVEACGGTSAKTADVIAFVGEIIASVNSKN